MSRITSKNAVVFGVSADTVESHKGFAEKEKLNFPLLADPGKEMIKAYGVLGASGFPNRVTFVIGPDGRIVSIDQAVNDQFERGGATLKTRHGENLALALSDWKAAIGQPVPNFSLTARDGKTVSLFAPRKKAAVVFFMGRNCPASEAYDGRIAALVANPEYKDVQFLGIAYDTERPAPRRAALPNQTAPSGQDAVRRAIQTLDEIDRLIDGIKVRQASGGAGSAGDVRLAVTTDPALVVADHFRATTTPSVWVVNSKGIAVYSGAIDDNSNQDAVTKSYLKDALDAALANRTVAVAETKSVGCAIRR